MNACVIAYECVCVITEIYASISITYELGNSNLGAVTRQDLRTELAAASTLEWALIGWLSLPCSVTSHSTPSSRRDARLVNMSLFHL